MENNQKRYGNGTAFFQKEFSSRDSLRLAHIFGCDGEEHFRCALLFSRLLPTGFLLTDKAVHFEDGTKITLTNENLQNESVKISSQTFFNATIGVLKIETEGFLREYYFKNPNIASLDALVIFLKDAFVGKPIENNDFSMTFKTYNGNAFFYICGTLIEKIKKIKNDIATKFYTTIEKIIEKLNNHEKTREKKRQEKLAQKERIKSEKQKMKNSNDTEKTHEEEEEEEKFEQKQQNSTDDFKPINVIQRNGPNFFVQFLDYIASISFITGLILALKPEILLELFADVEVIGLSTGFYDMIMTAGKMTFAFISAQLEYGIVDCPNLFFWRNLLVFACLLLFFILKLLVTFTSGSTTKLVAFLMLILTILASLIVKEKLLLFIAFIVILYFAFEILCGVKAHLVWGKFLSLLIVVIIEYLILNFTMSTVIRISFANFINVLGISGLQWW